MNWFLALVMLAVSSTAFSRDDAPIFNELSVLTESVLEQQRGGFFTADTHFSIGLTMKVVVDNKLAYLSTLNFHDLVSNGYNIKNAAANNLLSSASASALGVSDGVIVNSSNKTGAVNITPVLERSRIGLIIQSTASNMAIDASINVNASVPINYEQLRIHQNNAARISAATRMQGY